MARPARASRSCLKILFAVSEVAPVAKTGGLADVAAALPKALARLGHDVRIVLPLYRQVDRGLLRLRKIPGRVLIPVGPRRFEGRVWKGALDGAGVTVYGVEQADLFDREGLYQDHGKDHPDNLARFSFFSQAALRMIPALRWTPDLLHSHDWQAALACAHLTFGSAGQEPALSSIATVLTVHNLAYQGLFPSEQWPLTGLPADVFRVEALEFYRQINCLKGGLMAADQLTTVSPTYAKEIQSPAFGCGLEGVLASRRGQLVGILNGIDQEEWNPETDPRLAAPFSVARLSGKARCKQALRRRLRLSDEPVLLIGMIQRLAEQKGFDIFLQALEGLMALPLQVAILGTGDPRYHAELERAAKRFPGRLAAALTFDEPLAHQIEAGADAFLMPSRFEPCGLNQMYSMRYGTVPVVKRVGGLADTVADELSSGEGKPATGFVFEEHSARALLGAVKRALAAFNNRAAWARLMRAGMRQDFSWDRSAQAYLQVYERALAAHRTPARSSSPVPPGGR